MNIPTQPMREALAYWQKKVPLNAEAFYRLADEYRVRAFTVSNLAKLDQVMTVQKSLGKAIETGQSMADWRKEAGDIFTRAGWTGNNRHRLDVIFRNNIQAAYSSGKWTQAQDQARQQPFGMYSAINDNRVRPEHLAHDGKVYPLGHPFWTRWWPPNGHNCRCDVVTLSAEDVKAMGKKIEGTMPDDLPDEGFRANPGQAPFEVKLDRYPAHLRQHFLEKAGEQPFAQMRKFLGPVDMENMQTLTWAKQQGGVEGFGPWVEGVLGQAQATGQVYPAGNLPPRVLNRLETQPRLALTLMSDRALLHLSREAKRVKGSALTSAEAQSISDRFRDRATEWFLDTQDPAVLLAWERMGDVWVKVVVRTDRKFGEGIANEIVSAGVVKQADINVSRYKKL